MDPQTTLRKALEGGLLPHVLNAEEEHPLHPQILDVAWLDFLGTPYLRIGTVDDSAIVITARSGTFDIPLTDYQGVRANRHPLGYDTLDQDVDRLTPVYTTGELVGDPVRAAHTDLRRLARTIAHEALRPYPEQQTSDLVIAALAKEGITATVECLGGPTRGVVVDAGDGTHLTITNHEGDQITYPTHAHQGLAVQRCPHDYTGTWRMVYESNQRDAEQDAHAAAAAITAELARPLTDTVHIPPIAGPIDGLLRELPELRVSAILVSLLTQTGHIYSVRSHGAAGEMIRVATNDDTHIRLTGAHGEPLPPRFADYVGLRIERVIEGIGPAYGVDTPTSATAGHDVLRAFASLIDAVEAIRHDIANPGWT